MSYRSLTVSRSVRLAAKERQPRQDRPVMGRWLEEYSTCGCTFVARFKRELPGYCSKHGNDKVRIYKLSQPAEVGHA